jgi:hypothetical protein
MNYKVYKILVNELIGSVSVKYSGNIEIYPRYHYMNLEPIKYYVNHLNFHKAALKNI